jgi:hypothetical protein
MYRPCVAGAVLCIVEVATRVGRYIDDTKPPGPAIQTAHEAGRGDTATIRDTGIVCSSADGTLQPARPRNGRQKMLKTFATMTAFAALTATSIAPAHASWSNGLSNNGLSNNALTQNALGSNSLTINALDSNSLTTNALDSNSLTTNALYPNSLTTNALTPSGAEAGESILSIQAIELPPETR